MNGIDYANALRAFEIAKSEGNIGKFSIGIIPYARTVKNDEGISTPVIEPNLLVLYYYYKANPDIGFDVLVQNSIEEYLTQNSDNAFVIYCALIFITAHLEHEKNGTAAFKLEIPNFLNIIRESLKRNSELFKKPVLSFENGFWGYVEFYDSFIEKNYNLKVL